MIPLKNRLALIFDMDGVLVDTPRHNWQGIRQTLAPYGVVISDAEIKSYLGKPLAKQFAEITTRHTFNLTFEDFLQQYTATFAELELRQPLQPGKGLRPFLKDIRDRGVSMGVGTSSIRPRAERLLELVGIRDFFEVVVTAEDVPEHKPSPHIFLEVARQLKRDPGDCVVFEDAANGIEAAKRGDFKAVGLLSAFQDADDLSRADLLVHDFINLSFERLQRLIALTS